MKSTESVETHTWPTEVILIEVYITSSYYSLLIFISGISVKKLSIKPSDNLTVHPVIIYT